MPGVYTVRKRPLGSRAQAFPATMVVQMARSDLLLTLVEAGTRGDQTTFRRAVAALAAEERAKRHDVLAERLAQFAHVPAVRHGAPADDAVRSLVDERVPKRSFDDLVLTKSTRALCREVAEEQMRREVLRAHGLEPRHRVLLVGPPGNGKTTLAEALAGEIGVVLIRVRYDGLIGSFLGETATRMRRVFAYAAARPCVLLLDELDAVAKERGDVHETGEIKRVVSSLLVQMDDLPSHVVVVAATNHPELLDRAVWRRFQVRIAMPMPSAMQLRRFLRDLEKTLGSLGTVPRPLELALDGVSFSELEQFREDVLRRVVLAGEHADAHAIVAARLRQWRSRRRTLVGGTGGEGR